MQLTYIIYMIPDEQNIESDIWQASVLLARSLNTRRPADAKIAQCVTVTTA